jgi:putative SOS response-associated peptidase YedK
MKDGEREVGLKRWGFKLPDRLLFNARSETMATTKFWKPMLTERRCIVPAASFFEWQKSATAPKPKYRLSVKGKNTFGMAGVWSPWLNPKTDQWEDTFAVITTDPNGKMSQIHDRQPVILEPKEYEEWLSPSEQPLLHLLRIGGEEDLIMDPMDTVKQEKASEIVEAPQPGLFD